MQKYSYTFLWAAKFFLYVYLSSMVSSLRTTALNDRTEQWTLSARHEKDNDTIVVYLSVPLVLIYNWGIRTIHRSYNLYLIVSVHLERMKKEKEREEFFFHNFKISLGICQKNAKKLYTKLKSLTLLFFCKKKVLKIK